MKHFALATLWTLFSFGVAESQTPSTPRKETPISQELSAKQKSIVAIAGLTAKGDLAKLKDSLNKGLDAGLTINEAKEVLVHLYAYTGFPRSLNGINTLIAVVEDRKKRSIKDNVGREASPIKNVGDKYERGKKVLETLTGRKETGPKTGFAAFSPEIDRFLKEHLFADIFERDVLKYSDREIVTISALTSLGGVEPQLKSHLGIGLNVGLTASQLGQLFSVIEENVGKLEADAGRKILAEVAREGGNKTVVEMKNENSDMVLSRPGSQAASQGPEQYFTGRVTVEPAFSGGEPSRVGAGRVTFEAGARSAWHTHPLGQTLVVTNGVGWTQVEGGPKVEIRAGDVVWCPPNTQHWHGATATSSMTHIAITESLDGRVVDWMEKVSDDIYMAPIK